MTDLTAPMRYIDSAGRTITIIDPTASADSIDPAAYGTGTAAINAAIDQAHANWVAGSGSTTVYLRAGDWVSEGTIILKSGVTLAGAGRHSTTIVKTGQAAAIADPYGGDIYDPNPPTGGWLQDAGIRDLWIDCAQQSTSNSGLQYAPKGIYFTHVKRGDFRNMGISDSAYSAFGLDYATDHTVIDNCIVMNTRIQADGSGGNGFGLMSGNSGIEDLVITNCTAINVRAGVVVEVWKNMVNNGKGPRVANCLSINCLYGFENAGVPAGTFDSCVSISARGAGFKLGKGDHMGQDLATGAFTVSNCVAIDGVIGVDAYFDTPAAARFPGLAIQGCTIQNNSGDGVRVTLDDFDVPNYILRGNTISQNGGWGVRAVAAADALGSMIDPSIIDNDIIDNASGGVLLDAALVRGRVETNALIDTTGTAQPIGISIPAGRTMSGTAFGGGRIKAATPVSLAGALVDCHVGLIPGWTRDAGAPTLTAPRATLYERTDGAAGSLLYVNTDGAATWTAIA